MAEAIRTITLQLMPLPIERKSISDILTSAIVKLENGSEVSFSDSMEAYEFLMLWFGMTEEEINIYWHLEKEEKLWKL